MDDTEVSNKKHTSEIPAHQNISQPASNLLLMVLHTTNQLVTNTFLPKEASSTYYQQAQDVCLLTELI